MKYLVRWLPAAEQELAALWMSAKNRAAVSHAALEIDQDLEKDPVKVGESRTRRLRIHFVAPLGILFRVNSKDCIVQVVHVWSFE